MASAAHGMGSVSRHHRAAAGSVFSRISMAASEGTTNAV
jgi:hypothetical protein